MSMMHTAIIFARGGSKGLPNKNILEIRGMPLIAWSISHAKSCSRINRVIVSTDSAKIKDIALDHGAEVPFMRPKDLASDTASELDAWRHAINELERIDGACPEIIISLPATSPLRIPSDIDRALDRYNEGDVDVVIGVTPAHRNPYFNMVNFDNNGHVHIVGNQVGGVERRQDAPEVFDITTIVYVANAKYILNCPSLFAGSVGAIQIPQERSIDIDTPYDFEVAKFMMSGETK
jgi:N-acylneuraminate cytidylyltransferase